MGLERWCQSGQAKMQRQDGWHAPELVSTVLPPRTSSPMTIMPAVEMNLPGPSGWLCSEGGETGNETGCAPVDMLSDRLEKR